MDRLANLLGATALLLSDAVLDGAGRDAGRSGAAAAALAVLAQEPGLGIEALRRPLGLTQSATVRLVDALVDDGLARRGRGADARSIAVELTPAGQARAAAVLAGRARTLDAALAPLSAADRETLTALLETLLGAATEGRDHAEHICRMCDLAECPSDRCPVDLRACATEQATATEQR